MALMMTEDVSFAVEQAEIKGHTSNPTNAKPLQRESGALNLDEDNVQQGITDLNLKSDNSIVPKMGAKRAGFTASWNSTTGRSKSTPEKDCKDQLQENLTRILEDI